MCTDERHEYSEQKCSKCGEVFCWNCCGRTNVHHGGKYAPDFMLCPKCGHDILADEEE
jgi:hypothetical protein